MANIPDLNLDVGLPANVEAEKTILGAILLDNEAFFDDSFEIVPDDFSLDSHRRIYDVMNGILFGEVEGVRHVDIVTLANELSRREWVESVGGIAYIASLTEGLPRRPVIEEYVWIVKDKARLRKLMLKCSTAIARAADQTENAASIIGYLEEGLAEITGESTAGAVRIGSITAAVEERVSKNRTISAERTALEMTWGLEGLDTATHGCFRGEFTVIGAESSGGKLMDVDELIPTPEGFVRNGDLVDGDTIYGQDGKPYVVLKAHPIQEEEAYRVCFDDGTETVVHAGHLWQTWTRRQRQAMSKQKLSFREKQRAKKRILNGGKRPSALKRRVQGNGTYAPPPIIGTVKTTEEIMRTLLGQPGRSGATNHAIPVAKPLEMPYRNLSLDPYVLGAWLGDGTSLASQITIGPRDQVEMSHILAEHGFPVRKLKTKNMFSFTNGDGRSRSKFRSLVASLGVFGQKSIPHEYLWSSYFQRLELLRGLMDTDGCCNADGQVEFTNMNRSLCEGVYFLAASLGAKPYWDEGVAKVNGKECGPKYRVKWTSALDCFSLRRKLLRLPRVEAERTQWRHIVNVEQISKRPMRCLTTSNPTGLYLFGVNCNVTHNTAFGVQLTLANALEGTPVVWFSMEMAKEALTQRFYPSMSEILTNNHLRDPRLMNTHTHMPEMHRISEALSRLPIDIDETSPLRIDKLKGRIKMMVRKWKKETHGNRILVILDYLQLIKGMPKMSPLEQFSHIIFTLRDIPKEIPDVHLVALSQYSQGDKFVKKSAGRTKDSLYGGSVIHHAAQNVFMISIEDPEKRDEKDLLDAAFRIAKQREGKRTKVTCHFDRDHLRFCYPQPFLRT